jgi:rubrerythrin
MKKRSKLAGSTLIGTLNDLLQLDIDAVQAYALVIRQLESPARKQTVKRYQADHQRHVKTLKELIRAHGGMPVPLSHLPTGPFKLAMQATASLGDDKAVLLAFKTNERQTRDKYRRAAKNTRLPADVARAVKRGARDEERHYQWIENALARLGAGKKTAVGKVSTAAGIANARMVDAVEAVEKPVMVAAEASRRGVRAIMKRSLKAAAVAAVVSGAAGVAYAAKKGRFR